MLALACAVDRAAWRHVARTSIRRTRHRFISDLFGYLEPLGCLLPGSLGGWLRWAGSCHQLGRLLGAWFRGSLLPVYATRRKSRKNSTKSVPAGQ